MNMERTSRSQDAYQEILVMIGDGKLAPDDLLQEAPLGVVLGMSRTPIREALRRIEANELAHRKGRFLRVRGPTPEEISEIFVLLDLLEPYCIRPAAETVHGQAMAAGLLAYPDMLGAPEPICARTEIAVSRFLGETYTNSAIGQQVYELRCRLLPVGPALRGRAAHEALVAMLSAISKGNENLASQACHARLAAQATALLSAGLMGSKLNDIADEKGRQA